uniref:Uncharacterized protein n=1 Tax=Aegilops tauschii subsp. strangulata TaxID=200361 RepID=A0A453RK91_AEGTS
MCFFSHESLSRLGEEQVVPRQQPVCFLFRLDLLMPIPGATTPEALVSGPRGPRAPDERAVVADRVPPLEAAIRGFADRGTDVGVNPVLGTIFDSLVEAYEFYNLYSWEVGFGIRYGKSRQNVNGTSSPRLGAPRAQDQWQQWRGAAETTRRR